MKIACASFNTEYTIRADRLAIALEERGFESMWVTEHTHIPVPDEGDPIASMPQSPGGDFVEEEYRHISDPFTSLAAAAAVTNKLILGTSICLINQHHPTSRDQLPHSVDSQTTVNDVKQRMQAHGRDPHSLEVSLFFLKNEIHSHQTLDQAQAIGADRVISRLPAIEESDVLKLLDDYADALVNK